MHPSTLRVVGEGREDEAAVKGGTSGECQSYANLDVCRVSGIWLATPFGEWLGSGADEGRAKLR